MSEFSNITLSDFLLTKYLDAPRVLFGWRFEVNRYYNWFPDTRRGFWIARSDEARNGTVEVSLHWLRIYRKPHSEKRKAAWAARVKERSGTLDRRQGKQTPK